MKRSDKARLDMIENTYGYVERSFRKNGSGYWICNGQDGSSLRGAIDAAIRAEARGKR